MEETILIILLVISFISVLLLSLKLLDFVYDRTGVYTFALGAFVCATMVYSVGFLLLIEVLL